MLSRVKQHFPNLALQFSQFFCFFRTNMWNSIIKKEKKTYKTKCFYIT